MGHGSWSWEAQEGGYSGIIASLGTFDFDSESGKIRIKAVLLLTVYITM